MPFSFTPYSPVARSIGTGKKLPYRKNLFIISNTRFTFSRLRFVVKENKCFYKIEVKETHASRTKKLEASLKLTGNICLYINKKYLSFNVKLKQYNTIIRLEVLYAAKSLTMWNFRENKCQISVKISSELIKQHLSATQKLKNNLLRDYFLFISFIIFLVKWWLCYLIAYRLFVQGVLFKQWPHFKEPATAIERGPSAHARSSAQLAGTHHSHPNPNSHPRQNSHKTLYNSGSQTLRHYIMLT